jgi:hypothetical protein
MLVEVTRKYDITFNTLIGEHGTKLSLDGVHRIPTLILDPFGDTVLCRDPLLDL